MSSLPAVDLAKGRKFQLSPLSSPKSPANKIYNGAKNHLRSSSSGGQAGYPSAHHQGLPNYFSVKRQFPLPASPFSGSDRGGPNRHGTSSPCFTPPMGFRLLDEALANEEEFTFQDRLSRSKSFGDDGSRSFLPPALPRNHLSNGTLGTPRGCPKGSPDLANFYRSLGSASTPAGSSRPGSRRAAGAPYRNFFAVDENNNNCHAPEIPEALAESPGRFSASCQSRTSNNINEEGGSYRSRTNVENIMGNLPPDSTATEPSPVHSLDEPAAAVGTRKSSSRRRKGDSSSNKRLSSSDETPRSKGPSPSEVERGNPDLRTKIRSLSICDRSRPAKVFDFNPAETKECLSSNHPPSSSSSTPHRSDFPTCVEEDCTQDKIKMILVKDKVAANKNDQVLAGKLEEAQRMGRSDRQNTFEFDLWKGKRESNQSKEHQEQVLQTIGAAGHENQGAPEARDDTKVNSFNSVTSVASYASKCSDRSGGGQGEDNYGTDSTERIHVDEAPFSVTRPIPIPNKLFNTRKCTEMSQIPQFRWTANRPGPLKTDIEIDPLVVDGYPEPAFSLDNSPSENPWASNKGNYPINQPKANNLDHKVTEEYNELTAAIMDLSGVEPTVLSRGKSLSPKWYQTNVHQFERQTCRNGAISPPRLHRQASLPVVMEDFRLEECTDVQTKIEWKKGEQIGKGTFGKVFMGLNERTGELFAVKQIYLTDGSEHEVTRLEREILLMKSLDHKHIVRYLGTARENHSLYIFLEYVPGGSIANMLSQFGSFKEDLVRKFVHQILLGVRYLHKMGIIHRDIKGANVLVTDNGIAKLADFGCSKQLHGIQSNSLEDSLKVITGSVPWMAPEVIKQTGRTFYPADIWSVGATVIEMATGSHPWPEFNNQLAALFHVATTTKPPAFPENLSPLAHEFIGRCLVIDERARATAEELLNHPFILNGAEPS